MNRWDKWFLDICKVVGSNSKCLSRKIGAVIVRDKSIISTGYNGPPRGIDHCDSDERYQFIEDDVSQLNTKGFCPRQLFGYGSGEALDMCIAGHAERNALINAAREGIKVKGATMYMDCGVPCTPCLIEIINAGISVIVVTNFKYYDETSKYLIDNATKNGILVIRDYEGKYLTH